MRLRTETKVGLFVFASLGVFGYSIFLLGFLDFGKRYTPYYLSVEDVQGLGPKAEVRVCGVKVGSVDQVTLQYDKQRARLKLNVVASCKLYEDARAQIRQDGLVGPKFVDLVPGSSDLLELPSGSFLLQPARRPPAIDEMTPQLQHILENIAQLTEKLNGTKVDLVLANIAATTAALERMVNTVNSSFDAHSADLKNLAVSVQDSLNKLMAALPHELQESARKLDATLTTVQQAATNAQRSLEHTEGITRKISQGEGSVGRFINDPELHANVSKVADFASKCASAASCLMFIADAHIESMLLKTDGCPFRNQKGYAEFRVLGAHDYFGLLQLVGSEQGWPQRWAQGPLLVEPLPAGAYEVSQESLTSQAQQEHVLVKRNQWRVGLQAGKLFHNAALRVGLFDGTPGIGVDYMLPMRGPGCGVISTLECFDWQGQNRVVSSNMPHAKWILRCFMRPNLYLDVGADDFLCKQCATPFLGVGLRFNS